MAMRVRVRWTKPHVVEAGVIAAVGETAELRRLEARRKVEMGYAEYVYEEREPSEDDADDDDEGDVGKVTIRAGGRGARAKGD